MAIINVHRGYQACLGIAKETELGTAVTPPTKWLEFESETFDEDRNWFEGKGVDGTRSKSKTREVETTLDPKGGFVIDGLQGADLDLILELLLGNYASGTGYLGDTLPSFTAVVHKPPRYDVYAGCKLSSGRFEAGQEAQGLKFTAELIAMALTEGDSDDLGTPSYAGEVPLTFARSTFSVAGSAVRVKDFNLTVANALDDQVYRNSQTRLALPENDERAVNGELTVDWNAANYTAFMARWRAAAYAEFRAEFTNGVYVVTFVCPNCRFPTERGKISGKEGIEMPVKLEARSSAPGESDEIYIYRRTA